MNTVDSARKKRHPEAAPDEVWVTNTDIFDNNMLCMCIGESYDQLIARTLRMRQLYSAPPYRIGSVAYDIWGEPIDGMVPIFRRVD